jgi:predicted transcriptional regulator
MFVFQCFAAPHVAAEIANGKLTPGANVRFSTRPLFTILYGSSKGLALRFSPVRYYKNDSSKPPILSGLNTLTKAIFMTSAVNQTRFIELAADLVSAYVSNNTVSVADVPGILVDVHAALVRLSDGVAAPVAPDSPKPAIAAKKSVTSDFLICLEDGKKFKSLKRHLRTQYNMTPEAYREKWSLPMDYPMVAPNYAKARSQLAKQMGLGQQRRRQK